MEGGLKDKFEKVCDNTLGLKLINTIVRFQLFGTIKYEHKRYG